MPTRAAAAQPSIVVMATNPSSHLRDCQQHTKRRLVVGWGVVLFLVAIEFLILKWPYLFHSYTDLSGPSPLSFMREHFTLVESFARCTKAETAVGFMLAVNVLFFPIKLVALLYAHTWLVRNPDAGLRGVWNWFYLSMVALVATVPLVMWLSLTNEATALPSLDRKLHALCHGGMRAFLAAQMQGGFALLGAWFSATVFIGAMRAIGKRIAAVAQSGR